MMTREEDRLVQMNIALGLVSFFAWKAGYLAYHCFPNRKERRTKAAQQRRAMTAARAEFRKQVRKFCKKPAALKT